MGSDAQAEAPPAEPAAPPAAAAGKEMGIPLYLVIAVVVIIVVAAVGYVMISDGGNELKLEGQWTVSGGEVKLTMVMDNDTANKTWMNSTIPADPTIIDFDDDATTPEGWVINDLGDGDFEIVGFAPGGADLGTITGHYEIDGDVMTITMSGSGNFVESGTYIQMTFDYTQTMARA